MAGGGVQKIYMVFLREPSRRDRSGSDLFHLRDGFEIKMNFDRNVSCFIFVNALMHGCTDRIPVYGDSVLRTADKRLIRQMANTMGVSFSAFLIRLRELGCLCYRPLAEYITEEMGLGQDGGAG